MKPNRRNPLLAAFISLTLAAPSASAANWFWDGGTVDIAATGNGASGGTAGNWNTTTLNWDQGNTLAHVAWDSTNTANFGGTAGAVAVGAGITANGLTFTTAGYSFNTNAITMASGSTITSLAGTQTFTGGLATADNILRFTNTNTTNNFGNATIFTVGGNIGGASNSVQINGSGTRAPVGFSGTLSWGGTTTVSANNAVHFLTATVTGLATGGINMGAGSTILRQSAIDNTFLGKIAATTDAFTIVQTNGSTGNALNLSNFPNASLAVWDNVGTVSFAFTGLITAGSNGYRFGSTRAGNIINITTTANVLSGTAGLQLITGSLGNLNITNANNFSGNTINNASGKTITLGNALAIQNSAIDTAGAGTYVAGVTAPTIGGLIGSKNLRTNVFANAGYDAMTSLTLNPGTGKDHTYSGVIANSTGGLSLTKSGVGTQVLSGLNTFAGNVTINAGILAAGVSGNGTASALGGVSNTRTITVNTGGTLRADVGNIFNNNFASPATSLPALNIAGGTVTNGGTATNSALGNITLTGGTLSAASGTGHTSGYGVWNLNGTVTSTGTSTISSASSFPITLSAAAGTTTVFDVTSGTLNVSAGLGQVTASGDERTSSLTKSGSGTMVLSGSNTYTGSTLISGGTFTLSGSGSVNGSSGITVNGSGAKFLQTSSVASTPGITLTQGTLTGNGTVGAVNVADTVNAIISNNNGVAGASLTIGALTFNGAATVDTFSNSTSAPIITTSLDSNAAGTVIIKPTAASWANGSTYDLISYGSIGGAGLGQFSLGMVTGLTARQSTTLGNSANAITLAIAGDNPKWTGGDNGNWQIATTGANENWTLVTAGTPTTFLATDDVLFDDTAAGTTTIDINLANVAPFNTTFNNSTLNYTLGSSGGFGISSGGLTKSGSGSLTINNANTYTGGTTLNGGILRATTSANALGAGVLTLTGGELQLANDTGLSFGRNTTVTGNAQITSDTLTAVAGVTQTLGTLSIGAQTLTIAKGSLATGTTAGVTFGATTLTGAPTFSIGTGSALNLAAVTNAGNTITLTGAGNFSQTGTLSGLGGLTLDSGFSGTATLIGTGTNYSGATTISGGKLVLSSTSAFASAVTVNAGTTLQYSPTGTNSHNGVGAISLLGTMTYAPAGNSFQTVGTFAGNKIVTVSGGSSVINISPGGTFATSTGGLYLDGGLQGSSALTVNATTNGFGLVLRTGSSTYSGAMIVNGTASITPGTGSGLVIGFLNATANATLPNANLTINGTLELGNNTSGMGWAAGTTANLSGQTFGMNALDGTGVIVANMSTAASTRTLSVGNNGGSGSFSGIIANGTNNTLSFTKNGTGTQTLSGLSATAANNYSGTTTVGGGTLAFTTTNPSLTGGLTFGASAGTSNTGALDLSTSSTTFGGALLVRTNSAMANTISIGAGQTLTVANSFTIGYNDNAADHTTKLTVSGLGELKQTAGNFQLGGNTTSNASFGNAATLDMSGLAKFTYNSAAGTFRIGDAGGNTGTGSSTLILANTSDITALSFTMDSPTQVAHLVQLGSVANTINADTIAVGVAGNRSGGTLNFNTGTGTLTIRNTAGTGRANMTVGYGSANTAVVPTSLVNLTGHSSDLLLGTLQVAGRTNATQGAGTTATFSFDTGTLDATGVTVGVRAGTSGNNGLVVGTLNLGGGNVDIGASGLSVGLNTSSLAANTLNATVNISGGGTVDIGNTAGLSVTLGSSTNALAGATTAALNLTGGTTTLTGDIRKGTAAGTVTSTLTLNGASAILDMGGNDITNLDSITYTDGTLKNLGIVNTGMTLAGTGSRVFDQGTGVDGDIQGTITGSGIGLTKQGVGKLTLSGTNNYTSATLVSAGTLFVTGSITSDVTVSNTATLGGGGSAGAITFGDNSFFDIALALAGNPLDSAAGTISFAAAGFGVDNLVTNGALIDWGTIAAGTYTLITGNLNETNLDNFGLVNAADIGGGRSAYFQEGSLQLVVVPEPSTALLGALGLLALLRRRR